MDFLNNIDWSIEWIGIIATTITLYSFSIKHSLEFRKVNIFASTIWLTYGLSINSSAVFFTNSIITLLHVYHLYNHYFRGILLDSKNSIIIEKSNLNNNIIEDKHENIEINKSK